MNRKALVEETETKLWKNMNKYLRNMTNRIN